MHLLLRQLSVWVCEDGTIVKYADMSQLLTQLLKKKQYDDVKRLRARELFGNLNAIFQGCI